MSFELLSFKLLLRAALYRLALAAEPHCLRTDRENGKHSLQRDGKHECLQEISARKVLGEKEEEKEEKEEGEEEDKDREKEDEEEEGRRRRRRGSRRKRSRRRQ